MILISNIDYLYVPPYNPKHEYVYVDMYSNVREKVAFDQSKYLAWKLIRFRNTKPVRTRTVA